MESNHHAVLWDMDGVLVDTGEFHFRSWAEVLGQNGIPFDRETFRRTFGMNNFGVLREVLGEGADKDLVQKINRDKELVFRQLIHGKVRPLPGVKHWLERLKGLGYYQAVASSGPQKNIEAVLNELDIQNFFDVIVSAANLPGKPDPTVFLEAARQVGAAPSDCTVIEDAIAGVEAARRAGMHCIAVTTTNPPDALSGADIVLNSLEELPDHYFRG